MGFSHSKLEFSQIIKSKLRNLPFTHPTQRDIDFLSNHTPLEKNEIRELIEQFLETHPDGRMNRKEFCELYFTLRKESPEKCVKMFENVFKALSIEDMEADLLTLREFFITYALTSPGDFEKKLEYAFEVYDLNHDNVLDMDEVREAVYGMLELFEPPKNISIGDIARDSIKNLKITCVARKHDFIEGLAQNKQFCDIVNFIQ